VQARLIVPLILAGITTGACAGRTGSTEQRIAPGTGSDSVHAAMHAGAAYSTSMHSAMHSDTVHVAMHAGTMHSDSMHTAMHSDSVHVAMHAGAMHSNSIHAAMHGSGIGHDPANHAGGDTAFAALQARGKIAMGVDQYTSTHLFDDLPDGGRIELQRDRDDPGGVRTIREHLRGIAEAFSTGDFSTPAFVHMQDVPGTTVMAERRSAIRYVFSELPRGGEVRITTSDPVALKAVHDFLAFQRQDHRAHGRGALTKTGQPR